MNTKSGGELKIYGESIQQIYSYFNSNKLIVNRRYQRKLVWGIEEKENFIDSITKGYPIPLILLAEKDNKTFEIIDGMQRLDSIISFINGEYHLKGKYFNLETMATSKLLKDNKTLQQKEPFLSQEECALIANYVLPISSYKENSSNDIDEIFIRINSSGKKLSKQELRQAGTIGLFSNLVRQVSCKIRGDVSQKDILLLNDMKKISIKNSAELETYGINLEEIFWIKNQIIRKTEIRESKDEEIIADILASIILGSPQAMSSKILDEFYNSDTKRYTDIQSKLSENLIESFIKKFITVYDDINQILNESKKNFSQLLFSQPREKISRYYIVLFLSIYDLIYIKNKKITNYSKLAQSIRGLGDQLSLSKGGGNWSAKEKTTAIDMAIGKIQKHFIQNDSKDDPAYSSWITEFENILSLSKTEQVLYDFKQGFYNIRTNKFDENNFNKIIKTLTAMANVNKNSVGYVIIGIADNKENATTISKKFNTTIKKYENFFITGIEKEATIEYKSIDEYSRAITQKISNQPILKEIQSLILRNLKLITYYEKSLLIFKIESQKNPILYDNSFYERNGNNVVKIEPANFNDLFERFK